MASGCVQVFIVPVGIHCCSKTKASAAFYCSPVIKVRCTVGCAVPTETVVYQTVSCQEGRHVTSHSDTPVITHIAEDLSVSVLKSS